MDLKNFGVPLGGLRGIIQPKTSCKFRVIFTKDKKDFQTLTEQVVAISRPSSKREPISLVIRDDVLNSATSAIKELAGKFDIIIELLDGGDHEVLESWNIKNCVIIKTEYSRLSYDSIEPCTQTLTIKYKNVQHTFKAKDTKIAAPLPKLEDMDLDLSWAKPIDEDIIDEDM